MSEQADDLASRIAAMTEVPCDHCGHRYDVHFYRPDPKHAGCNECVGEGLICPGFHAGTVNVDTSPPCANCNHTEGAHVFDYKGNGEDWCNVLECLCRKFKAVTKPDDPCGNCDHPASVHIHRIANSPGDYYCQICPCAEFKPKTQGRAVKDTEMDNPINYPNEPCDDGTCGHLGRNHAALLKESFGKELDRTPCLITGCDCERYWAPEGNEEIREEVTEETVTEVTVTRTTTLTVDLPITVEDFQDELTRISVAHGPDAQIVQAKDLGGLGLGVSRVELTIE